MSEEQDVILIKYSFIKEQSGILIAIQIMCMETQI